MAQKWIPGATTDFTNKKKKTKKNNRLDYGKTNL